MKAPMRKGMLHEELWVCHGALWMDPKSVIGKETGKKHSAGERRKVKWKEKEMEGTPPKIGNEGRKSCI